MKQALITLFILISPIYSCYPDFYNEVYMRDFTIILDSSEQIDKTLNKERFKKAQFHLFQTDTLSEMLYYEPCPF